MKTPIGAFETAHSDPRRLPSLTFPIIPVAERRSRQLVGVAKIMSRAKEQGMTMKVMTALMAAGFVAASGAAWAATDTDNMLVTASVNNSCTVTATALAFGALTISASKTTAEDASTTIAVDCDVIETVKLTFGLGANADGTQRRMQSKTPTGAYIDYGLYSDALFTAPLGSSTEVSVSATSSSVDTTIYGAIPADQAITNGGAFEDTVVVTVTYTGT